MKILKAVFIIILVSFPAYSYSSDLGALRVGFLEGGVSVKAENASDWMSVLLNMPLMKGDQLKVPESGRIEIQMSDGSFLRIDENSSFIIHSINRDVFKFNLEEGRAYVNFRGKQNSNVRIETPYSFIRASQKSKFGIIVSETGNLELSVFKGRVYAAGGDGMIEVRADKTLTLSEDYYADLSNLSLSDEWERWNRERDQRFEERIYSAQYLPEELSAYSSDFDEYGRWIYLKRYGYVWRPRIIVSSGWSPYRLGKWVWIGDDYVWISHEPWGWIPYHYGRWAYKASLGWVWVPPVRGAVYWGPGYVGWLRTPVYVAWIPLAPGDIYYGYGYYGPGSLNIINININIHKIFKKRPYKNIYIKDAVRAVYRGSFRKDRYKWYKPNRNPFVQVIRHIERYDKRPGKVSLLPFAEEFRIPDQRPVKRIKDRRYRVQRDMDTFQAGAGRSDKKYTGMYVKKRADRVIMKREAIKERNTGFFKSKRPVKQRYRQKPVSGNREKRYVDQDVVVRSGNYARVSGYVKAPAKVQAGRDYSPGIFSSQKETRIKKAAPQYRDRYNIDRAGRSNWKNMAGGFGKSMSVTKFNKFSRR
jgi:hypothetical protein